jgi:hypothetical protein
MFNWDILLNNKNDLKNIAPKKLVVKIFKYASIVKKDSKTPFK